MDGLPSEFEIRTQPREHTITPGIVAGIALFIATPNRSARWKIAWIAVVLLIFGALQSLFMILQVQTAYAEFFAQLSFPQRCTTIHQPCYPCGWIRPSRTSSIWETTGLTRCCISYSGSSQ